MSRIWEAFLVCGLKGKRVNLAPSSSTVVTYKAKLVTKIQTIKGFLDWKSLAIILKVMGSYRNIFIRDRNDGHC